MYTHILCKHKRCDVQLCCTASTVQILHLQGGAGSAGDVPEQLSVTFDVRVAVTDDHEEMEAKLHAWCEEVGPGSYCKFQQKKPRVEPTRLDDGNPWWLAFKAACEAL
jgi:acetylornithine deacetylase/succinyl-diaminopimelate desuccinylase-like protein